MFISHYHSFYPFTILPHHFPNQSHKFLHLIVYISYKQSNQQFSSKFLSPSYPISPITANNFSIIFFIPPSTINNIILSTLPKNNDTFQTRTSISVKLNNAKLKPPIIRKTNKHYLW